MRVIALIEDPKVIDKIIRHLNLIFEAESSPSSQVVQHKLLTAATEAESPTESLHSGLLSIFKLESIF